MAKVSDYIEDIIRNMHDIRLVQQDVDVLADKLVKLERIVKDQEETIEQLMKTVSELWRRL